MSLVDALLSDTTPRAPRPRGVRTRCSRARAFTIVPKMDKLLFEGNLIELALPTAADPTPIGFYVDDKSAERCSALHDARDAVRQMAGRNRPWLVLSISPFPEMPPVTMNRESEFV